MDQNTSALQIRLSSWRKVLRQGNALRGFCGVLVSLGIAAQVCALQGVPDVLHRRASEPADKSTDVVTRVKSASTLPPDVSGDYLMGKQPDEVIQVSLHGKELGGYISKRGDAESDQGTPLTFFFSHSVLDGPRISFNTYQIHGTWYSFEGTIVRGDAHSKAEEGYYLLQGTLMKYNVADKTQERRTVNLKLAREG